MARSFSGVSIGVMLALSVAGCTGNAAAPPVSASASSGCSHLGQYVAVGGTAGFNSLVNPDLTTALITTGRARLYEHETAIAASIAGGSPSNPYRILNAIEKVFSGTGPGEAELGFVGAKYFTLPAARYPNYYQYQYVESDLTPNAANVNVPYKPAAAIKFSEANVRAWKMWVRAGRSAGIISIAPIVAPNAAWKAGSLIFPPTRSQYYNLNSKFYDLTRFEALDGGGIALDAPSDFFLAGGSGSGYQSFIEQAIRWGNAHRLRTTVLVSPYVSRATFSEDTKKFVNILLAQNAVPSEWVVDDYEDTKPNDANAMGPDRHVNTASEVGLWLATDAPVYMQVSTNARTVGGIICRPTPISAGASFRLVP